MAYSARPNSFIRLRISAVTSEKVRVLGITMTPMFERCTRSAAWVTSLQIVEKPEDLPDRGVAGAARQQLRSAGDEDDRTGEQERRPEHTRHHQADNAGGYQQPAGLFRQLLDADRRELVERRLVLRRLGHRRGLARGSSLHLPVLISKCSVLRTNDWPGAGSSSACQASSSRIAAVMLSARFALL